MKSKALHVQEKRRSEIQIDSYRKPTQVGEESILRRVREFQLRNSANYSRNLGIREPDCI